MGLTWRETASLMGFRFNFLRAHEAPGRVRSRVSATAVLIALLRDGLTRRGWISDHYAAAVVWQEAPLL